MGIFSSVASGYVIFAFIFQIFAVSFVARDCESKSDRPLWVLLTIFTGPLGLIVYLLGRNR